jgi:hypothetical protein
MRFTDNNGFLMEVIRYCRTAALHYHRVRTKILPGGLYAFRDAAVRPEDVERLLEPDFTGEERIDPEKGFSMLRDFRAALMEGAGDVDVFIPLHHLARLFDESDFAFHCFCMGLSVELDRRFERVWGFLHDDLTYKRPSVDMLIRTYTADSDAIASAFPLFSNPESAMRLMFLPFGSAPLASETVALETRIRNFLLGQTALPSEYGDAFGLSFSIDDGCEPLFGKDAEAEFDGIRGEDSPMLVQLIGPAGAGKKLFTRRWASRNGRGVLTADLPVFFRAADPALAARTLRREAFITRGATAFARADDWIAEANGNPSWERLSSLLTALGPYTPAVFVHTVKEHKMSAHMPGRFFLNVALPLPDAKSRLGIWKQVLDADAADFQAVADKYVLTPGQIAAAAKDIKGRVTPETIDDACRRQFLHTLERYARKVPAVFTWDDIILAAEPASLLKRACDQAGHRRVVLEDWGFGAKLPYGRSMVLVFSGVSGTGKTMSAQILARDLRLDLYKVDLSLVVSKYIGETEQNLRVVFDEAQKCQAVLFFDEADSLFGKRTEVKDSHDRNANMETSFLLQKLEEHDGIVILSTNLLKNMDEAFKRRIDYLIEFTMPDAAQRLLLWRSMFSGEAPLDNVDYEFLAGSFELSGANIKSISLSAAYAAAAAGERIQMRHIVAALRIESKKLGKLLMSSDMGPYAPYFHT